MEWWPGVRVHGLEFMGFGFTGLRFTGLGFSSSKLEMTVFKVLGFFLEVDVWDLGFRMVWNYGYRTLLTA